ncbi:MAG: indole-3-glycerol phosphate synthase TrpC [Blautia sp.]|nr:indole-3-glycerol phosphate synthase TrpC [Blautia sp.]
MAGNILEEIAEKTRERVKEEKAALPLFEVRRRAEERCREEEKRYREEEQAGERGEEQEGKIGEKKEERKEEKKEEGIEGKKEEKIKEKKERERMALRPLFERNLRAPGMSFICEVKKASPSKGLIAPDFPYLEIARDYERAGAAAISCLTEPFYFLGKDAYLSEIAAQVKIPVLRKDFTVDPYMIYQAKALGAGAVLLICALLDKEELRDYGQLAEELSLSALVEAHDEEELYKALDSGARIIGVNNRDLRTFTVDVGNSLRLRALSPQEVAFVSESGIRTREDIQRLEDHGVDGVLIGETLMRSPDKARMLSDLSGRNIRRGL